MKSSISKNSGGILNLRGFIPPITLGIKCAKCRLAFQIIGGCMITSVQQFQADTIKWLQDIGQSQKWLARQLHKSPSSISYLLNEAQKIDIGIVERIEQLKRPHKDITSNYTEEFVKQCHRLMAETSTLNCDAVQAVIGAKEINSNERRMILSRISTVMTHLFKLESLLKVA